MSIEVRVLIHSLVCHPGRFMLTAARKGGEIHGMALLNEATEAECERIAGCLFQRKLEWERRDALGYKAALIVIQDTDSFLAR